MLETIFILFVCNATQCKPLAISTSNEQCELAKAIVVQEKGTPSKGYRLVCTKYHTDD